MASARSANANKSLLLITLMILMTQVGYLENLNPWINGEQTLDETDDVTETGGSGSSNTLTASVEGADLITGQAMTDITFEYIGPTTYGNYSTWEATNINSPAYSMPGASMQILVGDTFYFDASDQTNGTELWAYDTSNHSEWRVDDIRPGSLASQPGTSMSILVGDTIYFSADDGSTGKELWAHNTSNHSAWRVDDINSGSADSHPGNLMELLIGDTLYFSADDGTTGRELWAHNTSNSSDPWQVADINSGVGHGDPGKHLSMVIDDVLYFSADDGSTGGELYAYNTSNGSDPWLVADLFSGVTGSSPGHFMQVLVDDIIYFDARGGNSNGIELWSYDTTDHSTQRVTDINSGTGHSRPGAYFSTLVGDTIYFSATDGTTGVELWAYDTSNHSTWRVADINDGSQDSKPGEYLNLLVGDTIYFSADDGSTDVELWAHDTSNHSTWLVDDICSVGACNLPPAFGRPTGSVPGYNMQVLVGDTFYFDAFNTGAGAELWAHDTSNDSTWNVAEMTSGTGSGISAISSSMLQIAVGDTLYFSAQDGSNSMELWAHRGAEFTPPPANVNGASSCSSSPSLPLGLSIDSSTCTISGTPTVEAVNETYTVTAVLSGVTYQTTVWISSAYLPLVSSVEGANLSVDVPMTNITFEYNDSSLFTLTNPSWAPMAISTSADGPMGVYAADVDGDGDLDIVTASKTDSSSNGKVTWWENGGSGTWAANDIATNVDARSVYVEDIDGDGDLDVVAALFTQNTIKLYLNSGASNPVWTASNIDTNAKGATDVHAADMDGDGYLDVVSSSLDDDTIAWYKNDGQSSPGWTSTNIDTSRSSARAVDVADMDGDGDLDIVTASSGDDTIAWYANGGQSTPSFTKTDISNTADGARDVRAADMDGDGDIDIVSASYTDSTIAWYENNGQATSWSSGVDIVTNASGAESVYVADLDNDGDLDIVSGSALDDTVAWYENDGQTNPSWDAYDLSTSYDARGIHTADMDGDGDLEIISVSHNDNTVALFEQTGTRTWSNSMVSVTGASSCTASPNLPTGLNIDSSTCTISGTPTVEAVNATYEINATISGVTYLASIWLSSSYLELTPSVEGADLIIDEAMENITFQFNTSATINRAMENGVPVGILSGCGYELISHVMDSNDHHHLTHYDGCNSDGIYYSTNSGGSWTTTLIDSGVYGMGYANAIAVDSNDNPHIAYGIDNLYYTTLSNGVWSSPIVLDQTVGREISMIIDSSDNIHIASNKFITGGDLNYTSYVSGTWSTETVAAASSLYPGPTAIAVDSAGDVYIAMVQEATSSGANTNYLSVYNNSGGSWSSDFIDSGALGDYSVDLAIDSNDVTHLYYRKGGQHVIKNDASGSWSSDLYTLTGSTWDSMGDMVVESDGTVHIVAKHGTNSAQFQYATNKSGSWVNQAIANSSGFVHPTYNALALNSQGDMHYFFRAGSSGQTGVLYHLVESGASTVGSGSNAGQSSGSGSGSSTSSSLTAQNIAGGRLHTCAIVDDGKVACWGDNDEGQLGDGTTTDRSTPTLTDSLGTGRTAVQLATGDFFTCVLLDNDDVKCWGDNQYGQLGDGTTTDRTSPPSSGITFPTGRTPVALAAGDHQACAIMDDGSLTCWGNNHLGQIGDGTTTNRNSPTVVSLSSGDTVIKVGSGDSHSCALLDSGSIKCWGIQQYGQLGDGTTSSSGIVTTPALTNSLGSGRTAVNIGVGEMSTCALLDNDEVKCWGRNDVGELGDGTTTASNSPPSSGITFPSGETPVDLTNSGAGIFHYCALLDSGNVSCWGWNLYGTLGDGTTTNRLSPTLTDSLGTDRTAVHVTTGYGHTCALLDNGDIKCMGWNDQGQLGDGTTTDRTSPTLVSTSYTFNTALGSGSSGSGSGSGGGMTNVTNAMSCVATPSLPAGLNIDSNTCTISGTPTVEAVNATYEINATISGVTYIGSVWLSAAPFGTITSAVEGAALNLSEAMTPIALNYTSQAPPGSSGNGTTWIPTPPSGIHISNPRMADYFMLEHDDVIYFDAMMSNSRKAVYAFSTVNGTMWNTYDISSINSATNFQPYTGDYLAQFVGDDLFFTIKNGSGFSVYELWVYSTSNGTTWRAMQQTASSYGFAMAFVIGDRLYFDESHSGSQTFKFGVYDTSNHTYWNHSTTILSPTVGGCDAPGANFHTTVGDTIYFDACDASQSYGNEMYAFNTINGSYWRTTDLDNGANDSNPGERMHIVIDDVIYFDAQVGTGAINTHALYAYNTSNGTSWLAADLNEPGYDMTPHSMDTAMPRREPVVIGDTLYFDAAASPYTARTSIGSTCTGGHTEIYAYNIDNETAWCVADAGGGGWSGSGHNSGAAHNMLHLIGDVLLFDAETGSTQGGTQTRTNSLWAHNLSNGSTWEITTKTTFSDIISEVGNGFTVFSTDNALYFPARNNTVGMEVWGYDVVNETYWLVNDTCPGVCGGISGGDFHTLVHQGVFYSSVRISQTVQGEQHILGAFNPVYSSSTSSGGSGGGSSGGSSGVTWSTHPALPAGMSISAGVISGTPTVYALNQTYTIYANQSGYSTTHELYFSVDTNNAHTVVENQTIDPIGFHPPFSDGTTTWTVSPNLPASLTNSSTTGEITGTVTSTTTNATYTVTATHSDGSTETFTFNLQSLADYDGDGLANDLPSDYDAAEGPTPGLVADTDDDADGLLDTVETNTGTYVDSSNTGTDPLNPDTDGDGICDGPNAVSGVCVSGPDITNGGTVVDTPIVLLNNSDAGEIAPFYPVTGATYGLSPDLPTSMQFDSSNGSIWGAPDMLKTNTTYTMWANLTDGTTTSWTFFLEVLEDLDGDGMPDVLPGDYDAVNDPIRTPGLEEDLDDDGDGYNDTAETNTGLYLNGDNTGTDPRDPDTDDDGICDGPGTVAGVCTAGPDLTPFGPTATVVAVNNTMIPSVPPYYAGSGLTYGYSPDLPNGLTIDPNNGYLMGIPTETTGNITYTIYANDTNGDTYSWDFTIEVLEDSDGDGSPDSLPSDYDGDNDSIRAPPGLTEDLDDDGDGASDLDEIANGTEPLNPDTDGDGLCDGINAVPGVCFAGPDPYPNDPTMPIDTDGDGLPDDDSGWTGPPYADDDDDNDGYSDVSEDACGSDSLDASSIPADMDGDAICDGDDPDMDGDGIENVNETGDTTVPPGSSPINPDTDGDGICDGPESPVTSDCTAGPDMFPLDPSAWEDTDGDGYPNELFPPSTSVPPLEEDTDDDNDGWSDIDEVSCGSDPVDGTDMPVDENGDGICDVLDLDWDDDGIPNTNETDTGVYVDSSDTGTDPWNPDTDGDGFCDGPFAVMNGSEMICSAGPDPFPHDPTLPMDTDGDGLPNELPEDYIGNLVADDDDDNDGYTDVAEDTCGSDSLDNLSMPTDLDGDTICDGDDLDMDGDGILNDAEDATDSITSSSNADTDGDGVCDGPSAPAMPAGICTAGPDAFPDDPAAWDDTDGDGDPDEIVDGMTTDLVLDTDDDNDGWEDVDELDCETNSKDNMSTPFDGDDDGICDVLDTQTLGYAIYGNESDVFEAYVNQSDFVLVPNLTGMEPGTWTIEPALPDGLSFSGTARSGETGIISGIPTEASPMQNYTVTADNGRVNKSFTFGLAVLNDFDGDRIPDEESVTGLETDPDDDNDGHLDEIELKCGSDPLNQTSVPDVDEEGNCIEGRYAEDDSDDGTGVLLWCLPLVILLLVLLLLIPLLIGDKVALMGPEPENTTSSPAFMSGNGTKADPFVLRPIKKLKAGSRAESKEAISITNMSPEILVDLLDLAESSNDKRFMMYEIDGSSEESGYKLEADEEGRLRLRFVFDDGANPTYPGAEYEGLLKLGKASVYVSWTVEVKEDKRKMNQIRKEQEAAEKAEKEAKEAQEKAKAEAEAKEAEEKAEAEAKAAEEKAAKEAEKKAKAEEKAAAAALAKKEKEEAAAKKKEEAAAKKAKAAEEKAAKEAEEAEAKAKAEAEAKAAEEKAAKEAEKKAKAEEKAAAAAKKAKEEEEAKKKAEAEAKAAEEKAAKDAEKKAKAEEKAAAAAAAKKAKAAEEKAAKDAEKKAKAEEKAAAVAAAKKAKEEEEAKKKADADAKAAAKKVEKKPAAAKEAKKQEELQRVKKRAKSIDFKVIGEASSSELKSEVKKGATTLEVANAKDFAESGSAEINDAKGSNVIAWTGKDGNTLTGVSGVTRLFAAKAVLMVKDDLQVIKGIGPFIEEKLNALGITTYRQLANMTAKLETQVNEAIEFFPGRVKRDQWVAQAKILLGMDAKLDEKALKQAEELERVAQKAEGIDFAVLGVASASEADDLQKIKGIGPFIAEKLNALGIYKFSQLANMTSEIEEEVNVAIEFFPGRVKRDEWAKQAKELAKD